MGFGFKGSWLYGLTALGLGFGFSGLPRFLCRLPALAHAQLLAIFAIKWNECGLQFGSVGFAHYSTLPFQLSGVRG